MTIVFIISLIGLLLNIVGFVGCFLPILPGPTLNLLSLFMLYFTIRPIPFTIVQLAIFTLLTFVVLILDNVLPLLTAKAYGSSAKGVAGATIGLLIGFFFFPPFGMVFGAFIGAVSGEIISQKNNKAAFKAGLATMLGFAFGTGAKLAVSGIMTYYFIKAILV